MMILGISSQSHDAAISLVNDTDILFAAHSERYSKIKNDSNLCNELFMDMYNYGSAPDKIVFYENPWQKKFRQFFAGQFSDMVSCLPSYKIRQHIKSIPIEYVDHHRSHAATAFLSPFKTACVVVIDAIGEWDCISIWKYDREQCSLVKVESIEYPNSLGLFYTAFTRAIGLKPNEDEYIMMGLSSYGNPKLADQIDNMFFEDYVYQRFNLHMGLDDIMDFSRFTKEDIAASVQEVMRRKVIEVMIRAKQLTNETNLVYAGGVALNCSINSDLFNYFDNVWILPNPGDAGSSLGAIAAFQNKPINWVSPYLGHKIIGEYPIDKLFNELLTNKIVGVANGRAEFGPRALGNRSILADPRGLNIKDHVNLIKLRQKFRPFAPVILEEYFRYYYDVPFNMKDSKYMQFVCKNMFEEFPAVTHVDGTSRIQTVNKTDHPELHRLLTMFYNETGCPMLLNTSLNIKGQPIVNDELDVQNFIDKYNIPVYTKS